MLSYAEKKFLLILARRSLEKYLKEKERLEIDEESLPSEVLKEKRGVFVTLWKNKELRGCVGDLEGNREIYQSVIDNSLASGLLDNRFLPLTINELAEIEIEISILSPLKKLSSKNKEDLLGYLGKKRPGLFVKKNNFQATFLPQVWAEIEKPEMFLSELCRKAGLEENEWKKMDLEIYEYEAEVFKEKD